MRCFPQQPPSRRRRRRRRRCCCVLCAVCVFSPSSLRQSPLTLVCLAPGQAGSDRPAALADQNAAAGRHRCTATTVEVLFPERARPREGHSYSPQLCSPGAGGYCADLRRRCSKLTDLGSEVRGVVGVLPQLAGCTSHVLYSLIARHLSICRHANGLLQHGGAKCRCRRSWNRWPWPHTTLRIQGLKHWVMQRQWSGSLASRPRYAAIADDDTSSKNSLCRAALTWLLVLRVDQVATLRARAPSTDTQPPDQTEAMAGLKRTVASLQVWQRSSFSLHLSA